MPIELRDICKTFDNGLKALNHINLTIYQGELLVLVGPSGCGKSTLLRLLAGLDKPSSGDIVFAGEGVLNQAPQQRNVAMVFQNYALYPHKSVRENLLFPLVMQKLDKQAQQQRLNTVVQLLSLQSFLDQRPHQLSGGQKQRVAMGRALVREPRLFLLDEPLSNLDAKLRTQIRTEITALQKKINITTVYVTHDQVEAMTLGQRVAVLKDGELQQLDEPSVLYDKPATSFVANFIGNPGMNLIHATYNDQDMTAKIGQQYLSLKPCEMEYGESLHTSPGQELILGIRPEALNLNSKKAGLAVKVIAQENLGHENLIYIQFNDTGIQIESGDTIVARVKHEVQFEVGTDVHVTVDATKLHLFSKNGRRLSKL